jgi:hypothetical protein
MLFQKARPENVVLQYVGTNRGVKRELARIRKKENKEQLWG